MQEPVKETVVVPGKELSFSAMFQYDSQASASESDGEQPIQLAIVKPVLT